MDDPKRIPLEYEFPLTGKSPVSRPKWVYFVVGAYLLLACGLLLTPVWANWVIDPSSVLPVAVVVAVLVICGLTLLIVPARASKRRPVARRSVWYPIVASGLLLGVLVFSGGMALEEFVNERGDITNQLLIAGGVVWICWSMFFVWMTFRSDPSWIGMRLHRFLIAGSVLELLVAVPTHIVVRRRPDCCAGIATGMGICVGVVVMFIAFGPSVLLLYHKRWKQISGTK